MRPDNVPYYSSIDQIHYGWIWRGFTLEYLCSVISSWQPIAMHCRYDAPTEASLPDSYKKNSEKELLWLWCANNLVTIVIIIMCANNLVTINIVILIVIIKIIIVIILIIKTIPRCGS